MSEQIDNIKEKKEKIEHYKRLAQTIKANITSRKRPLIVEFSGLPKSGKTTVVNSLALFLRRNEIPTIIITERATVCPIKNKEHPDFNIWTGCTSLINMLNYKQRDDYFVIIIDRGIFDTLIWLNLLNQSGKLNDNDLKTFENFFLLERWRTKVDLVICMKTSIEKSLEREFKDLLTDIEGSIMNKPFLTKFLEVMEYAVNTYKTKFKKLIEIDTSDMSTIVGVEKVISEVIQSLEILSNEELITIPKEHFKDKLDNIGFEKDRNKFQTLERIIKKHQKIVRRKDAEEDIGLVQIIVCAILTYKNKIAIVTKNEIGNRRLHNKKMIWAGGHLQFNDADEYPELTILKSMKNCLKRELQEEFEMDYDTDITSNWKGIVYDNTHPKSLLHLGVVFQIDIKDEFMMRTLDKKNFRELSGQGNYIEFVDLDQKYFRENNVELEPWSVDILSSLFNITTKITKDSSQMVIF
ncbi:MAG: hypothetical protein GXX85_07735 [Ignavibacteria bacterium]|nr:hypothetical protein [Ignavibacteria bacterium]